MPRLTYSLPRYRKHKASGQAVVTIAGKDRYLGRHGSKASRMLYDRLVSEWLAGGRHAAPKPDEVLSVEEIIIRYWKHARARFRRKDGTPTDTPERIKPALRMLRTVYGNIDADEFGPIALKALRLKMIEGGNARRTVNDDIDRIRAVFRWAVSEELIDESVYRRLRTVEGLRKGLSEAKETEPIQPVDDDVVEATLPHLSPVVVDMVRFARYTGARPGEVCILRPGDIDQSGDVWVFIPERHKTEHHDKSRAIAIGPKAAAVLEPYLDRDPGEFCFKPSESVALDRQRRHAARVTPMNCGYRPGTRAAQRGRRKSRQAPLGDCYTNDSFRKAIHRACDRVFLPPEPLAPRPNESVAARDRRLSETQKKALKRWQSDHRWSPNQLRHSAATEIRRQFGIEAVAAVLGHSKTDTSEIYALRNLTLASAIAQQIG